MMKFVIVASLACLVLVQAAPAPEAQDPLAKPIPYAFSYSADSLGGRSSHEEKSDGNGNVSGFYTILGADGRERRVEYVADANGFRLVTQSNELGLKNESPANAEFIISPPTEGQMQQANAYLKAPRTQ